jgi:hypothetical protein
MKTNQAIRQPWSIVISPTSNGLGYQMNIVSLPNTEPAVRRLMDRLGDVLAATPVSQSCR